MSTDNNNNEAAAAAEKRPSHPLPPSEQLGLADNTKKTRDTGIYYINMYLSEMAPFGDDDIGSFDQVTPQHVEGDNLEKFISSFYCWLAKTAFRTIQNTWISTDKKLQYQKYAKQAIKDRFPRHHLFSDAYVDWHQDIVPAFRKQCDRSRQLDENINEVRKSHPLYPDVKDRGNPTAIRAKYLGTKIYDCRTKIYDCRTVAMNLLKHVKDKNTAAGLSEFNTSRAATARGGEHALLRWDEGTFDPYYCAPDFDWPIIKQLDRQCMFFFCHLSLYMICPYFGWGVYFLFGGLRRDGATMGATKNFVYPHLHKIKRNGVAERMTKNIRLAIEEETLKKAYTSRSMRKGQMGAARMNRDLDLTEEYAHSGHHHPLMNSNAEGYIESNPAIAAPGALAAAGYMNCHMRPAPLGFHALGEDVFDTVQSLVTEMFTNDMPRLQVGGNLRPVVMICAARLVGAYNDLLHDLGVDHEVVRLIRLAAHRANVEDLRVPVGVGPRYHLVLKDWSKQITEKFTQENDQVSHEDPKVNEELLRKLIEKVNQLEASSAARDERDRTFQSAMDRITIQKEELTAKDEKIKQQDRQIKKLLNMLHAAQQSSPTPGSPIRHAQAPVDAARKHPLPVLDLDGENACEPASKKTKASTSAVGLPMNLDGVEDISTTKVGGITVSMELERMWKEEVLAKKSKELKGEEVLSKEVLFKRSHTSLHMHTAFKQSSEMAKYDAGMTIVALAVSDDDWKKLCGELESKEARNLFAKIEKETMLKAIEIERHIGEKVKEGSSSTVHSLGARLNGIKKYQKETNRRFNMDTYVHDKLGEKASKQGTLLRHFAGQGNKKKK
uniref:Uncharacterized protein n=1 Tax=Skeletonema marinoi TaxID=267567 RepID=A0A7S0TGB4_9STRA|mmetsp:Transcript_859/g.1667  ORF Transcript_859/g.1667 Transcript_859/m.1667 type:complete len:835 (+) Transcript_859:178-2682(+)